MATNVHALKQASAAASPERAALRVAIEQHATAERRLAKINDARERAASVGITAWSTVKAAKSALEEAKTGEGRYLAAVALGEADAAASPLKLATDALTKAEADYELKKKTEDALRGETEAAENELASARAHLNAAVKAAVAADPATQRLVHDYQLAQKTYLDLCKLMSDLSNVGCSPVGQFGEGYAPRHNFLSQGSAPAAQAWLAAISQLRTDADTALPQE
jgi:hypothetical protein